MGYVQLSEAKKHLNIEQDFGDDDAYIESLIESAEEFVAKDVCVPLKEMENGQGAIPAPIRQAILLIIGDFYAVRESVVLGTLVHKNPRYESIIGLYRNYSR